jgi:hypothetical protein
MLPSMRIGRSSRTPHPASSRNPWHLSPGELAISSAGMPAQRPVGDLHSRRRARRTAIGVPAEADLAALESFQFGLAAPSPGDCAPGSGARSRAGCRGRRRPMVGSRAPPSPSPPCGPIALPSSTPMFSSRAPRPRRSPMRDYDRRALTTPGPLRRLVSRSARTAEPAATTRTARATSAVRSTLPPPPSPRIGRIASPGRDRPIATVRTMSFPCVPPGSALASRAPAMQARAERTLARAPMGR